MKRILDPDQEVEFTEMYLSAVGSPIIATTFNMSLDSVRKNAIRLGLPKRGRGQALRKILPEDTIKEVLIKWDNSISITQISVEYHTGRATIQRILRENGREVPTYKRGAKGPDSASWKGGRVRATKGYLGVRVYPDDPMYCMAVNGYVAEHRLLIARDIGRPLRDDETVHHINSIRDDNRLENLQLRNGHHGTGIVLQCLDCGSNNIESVELA